MGSVSGTASMKDDNYNFDSRLVLFTSAAELNDQGCCVSKRICASIEQFIALFVVTWKQWSVDYLPAQKSKCSDRL